MIHNARQYRITKAHAPKFAAALEAFDARPSAHPGVHPKLITAQRDAMACQLESLNEEIEEYERHRELAARLGLKEQQIHHYEATASLSRVIEIAQAITSSPAQHV